MILYVLCMCTHVYIHMYTYIHTHVYMCVHIPAYYLVDPVVILDQAHMYK